MPRYLTVAEFETLVRERVKPPKRHKFQKVTAAEKRRRERARQAAKAQWQDKAVCK